MSNPHRPEEEVTQILMACVAWAGQATPASRSLKEKGIHITPGTLKDWMNSRYAQRYEEMREKFRGDLERKAASDMLDIVALSQEATRLAIEKAKARLKAGEDMDPGRTAANLARVSQSATDKLMTFTSRPKEYTGTVDPEALARGLLTRFPQVFGLTEEPKQIEGGEGEPNG